MNIIWFDSVEDLLDRLSSTPSEDTLKQGVAEITKILLKHIKSDIYDAYDPKENGWVNNTKYQRRHVLEGSIKSFIDDDGYLVVTSVARPDGPLYGEFSNEEDGFFLHILEGGDGGNMGIWKGGFPRPAVSNAQVEVENSTKLNAIFEGDLKRKMNK